MSFEQEHGITDKGRDKALKVKAFGSEYNKKSNKRLLKKNKNYRIKHF